MTRRELVRRATVAGLSLSAAGGLLTACGDADVGGPTGTPAEPPDDVRRGGVLTLAAAAPGAEVDPLTVFDSGGVAITQLAAEYLAAPDAENNLIPILATTWEPVAGPRAWRFTIRDGVQWHDGSPLTSDDVVATFDRITDPARKASALSAFAGILARGNVEKNGDLEVTFHLERPFADFPHLVSASTPGAAILPAAYEPGQFAGGGVGTGPFVLGSVDGRRAVAERNPAYWQAEKPYLDGVEIAFHDALPAQVDALRTGAAHALVETPFAAARDLLDEPGVELARVASSAYRELHLRVDREPWKDKRVRQAVAYCLDREALVETLWAGYALPANDHGFAPSFAVAPDEDALEQRPQDHERARALLAEAGHDDGLEARLTVPDLLEIPRYAELVREQCRPAGIRLDLRIVDLNTYYGSGERQPWLEVAFGCVDWAARAVPSQLIAPAYTCEGAFNSAHWCNAEFDRVVAELDGELDAGKRRELATRAAELQHDETPAVIAFWIDQLRAKRSEIAGLDGPFPDFGNAAFRT